MATASVSSLLACLCRSDLGHAVCSERGRERKCSVVPSQRGFLFPRRLKLPCQNVDWDLSLLSSKFL